MRHGVTLHPQLGRGPELSIDDRRACSRRSRAVSQCGCQLARLSVLDLTQTGAPVLWPTIELPLATHAIGHSAEKVLPGLLETMKKG